MSEEDLMCHCGYKATSRVNLLEHWRQKMDTDFYREADRRWGKEEADRLRAQLEDQGDIEQC